MYSYSTLGHGASRQTHGARLDKAELTQEQVDDARF